MITAIQAKMISKSNEAYKRKLQYVFDKIKDTAEMGYLSTEVCVEDPLMRENIFDELKQRGFDVSTSIMSGPLFSIGWEES